ncbi:SGNH hydrolase-type esterase domain-containing protein [Fennellomyces sp. T-0311]|nr:SGNH hydrolase-type esterase domain-containing protein [Fennellomyces sp. T-0311]
MEQHVYSRVNSYQVLQRDFSTNKALVKQANGHVRALEVGGPYDIDDASNVLVGDVWVMAGQSNMRGNAFYKDPWTDPPTTFPEHFDKMVHMFQSNETWSVAREPTHRLDQSVRQIDHELPDPSVSTKNYYQYRGISPGMAFAKAYRKQVQVPVGLIASTHGGTTMDQWNPALLETTEDPYNRTLYGAMLGRIDKVENQITGILWYQGESDADDLTLSAKHGANLKSLIQNTRSKLKNDQMAFAYVQIARSVNMKSNDEGWNTVREQQRLLINDGWDTKRVGAVSSIDCEMDDRIHLSAHGLSVVGERLAVVAANSLNNKAGMSTPTFSSVTFESKSLTDTTSRAAIQSTLLIKFEYINKWKLYDDGVYGFSLHASDGTLLPVIYNSKIQEDGKSVRLFLTDDARKLDTKDVFLYYGYGMDPICNMETTDGMGLLAFGPVPVALDY